MPIKTGRRKQPVTTGLGAPGDHDNLPPPAPRMMPGATGPNAPMGGDTAHVGPGNMPHGPQGGPVGLGAHPGHGPPGASAGFFHGPGGPGGPVVTGPGPGMPTHGMPNGPQGPPGPGGPGPGMMGPGPGGPGGPGPGMPMHGPGGPPGPMNPAFFSFQCLPPPEEVVPNAKSTENSQAWSHLKQ